MGWTIYCRKYFWDWWRWDRDRIRHVEHNTQTATPGNMTLPQTVTQYLSFLFQATQFTGVTDDGDARVYSPTATSTVDEDTNVSVAAYANFDDVGGNAAASADVLGDASTVKVPLLENKSKTAYYRGHPSYLRNWNNALHPEVAHTKQFMTANSFGLNVPGTVTNDTKAFVYYDTNTAFNVSASISASLWFYPTDLSSVSGELFRYLLYRYIDASNYFIVVEPVSVLDNHLYVIINEAGVITQLSTSTIFNANQWNLLIVTYDPSTNALVLYLNNNSGSSVLGGSLAPVYTTDTNMYIGGLPGLPAKRYTGYIDNFVFWTGKILTSGEASNMWNHGTII